LVTHSPLKQQEIESSRKCFKPANRRPSGCSPAGEQELLASPLFLSEISDPEQIIHLFTSSAHINLKLSGYRSPGSAEPPLSASFHQISNQIDQSVSDMDFNDPSTQKHSGKNQTSSIPALVCSMVDGIFSS
jgi:hypothetical protein